VQPLVLEALQMPHPDPADALVSPYEISPAIKKWILTIAPDADEELLDQDFSWNIIERAMCAEWKPGELPAIEAWAEQNQVPLNWLVEGAARPKYFFPRPNVDALDKGSMISWMLPDAQVGRRAARALCVRSMWHLSHNRHEECWQDLLACHRLARHISQGFSLVHNLVAIAIESMATRNMHQLVHDEDISEALLQKIQKDLDSLKPRKRMDQFFEEGERFSALDLATRMAKGTMSPADLGIEDARVFQIASSVRIDWNIVLKNINGWYDRHALVARLPYAERADKLEELDEDIQRLFPTNNTARLAQSILSINARSEVAADAMMALMLPSLHASISAEDRVLSINELVKTSLALARYRAKNGEYPETLNQLVPDFSATAPTDYFTGKPLVYHRKPKGFLLYSLFKDGVDNGGTGIHGQIVEGEYVSSAAKVDLESCDLVVRVPKPPFKMPAIPLVRKEVVEEQIEEEDEELE